MKYIGIILVNWNNYIDTIECVNSLLELSPEIPFKIIISDNNSTNDSMHRIKEYFEKTVRVFIFNKNDKSNIKTINYDIAIVNTGRNGGFGYANNVAVKFLKHDDAFEYIWLLNNDTVVDKNSLLYLFNTYQKHNTRNNKVGAIGSMIYSYFDKSKLMLAGGFKAKLLSFFSPISVLDIDISTDCFTFTDGYISGASLFISKYLYLDINGFDESYFMYVEDVDFSKKIGLKGYQLGISVKSVVYHKEGASTEKVIDQKRPTMKQWKMWGYYELRNRTYYIMKYKNVFYYILPIYWMMRRGMGVLLFDKEKIQRSKLLFKALYDGFTRKMGVLKF